MRIAVNGAELFFDVYGSSLASKGNALVDKPVIVALHGGPGIDHSQFVPWLTPIADVDMLNFFFARDRHVYDVRPQLAKIIAPTLVLTGRHDKIAPPFASDEILKGIAQAEQEMFEQSGHRLMREENGKFLRTVRDFIGRL